MKTLKHKWIQQSGFKRHKCERCNCTKKWSEGWHRIVYWDRFCKFHLTLPSCELPNIKL